MPLLLTTTGVINEHGELLLIKRANNPFEGLFSLVGGKVENGEPLLASASREVREELGIDVSDGLESIGYKELFNPSHAIVFIFTAHISSKSTFIPEPTEVSEIRWVKKEDLDTLGKLPPNHQFVAEYIFTKIK